MLGPPSVSVSPVLWKFGNQILLTFKVRSPGDSQSLCWISRLGSLLWGLEFSQQCENFFGITVLQFVDHPPSSSIEWLMATFSKRTNATCRASQDFCCQSPSPHSGPLLTHASTGDPQTFTGRSGSVSCGGVTAPFPESWRVLSVPLAGIMFGFRCSWAPPTVLWWLLLCPWTWGIFFWWVPTFSC